jgi:hypothetical protein
MTGRFTQEFLAEFHSRHPFHWNRHIPAHRHNNRMRAHNQRRRWVGDHDQCIRCTLIDPAGDTYECDTDQAGYPYILDGQGG